MSDADFDFEGGGLPDRGGDDGAEASGALHSKRNFSRITGLTPGKIDALVRAGMPVQPAESRSGGNRFDLKACFQWLAAGGAAPADELSIMRQRKLKAEAERLEHANMVKTGDLVSRAEIQRELSEGLANLRQALLSVSARLTGHSEEQRVEVHSEITAAINALSVGYGGTNAVA